MSIDTLDYDTSVKAFKQMVKDCGGFVENETYGDGYSLYYDYWVDNSSKNRTFSAMVRIPSAKYDDFVESAGTLGSVRSKDAQVDNMSSKYRDLEAELLVYQTTYERYQDLLVQATDMTDILTITEELTRLEYQISNVKSAMQDINTDVAYSYVNMSIREVREYVEYSDPETFGEEVIEAFKGSWSNFIDFLQNSLIFIIYALPAIIAIAIISVIIVKAEKKSAAKREAKKAQKEASLVQASPVLGAEIITESERLCDELDKQRGVSHDSDACDSEDIQ